MLGFAMRAGRLIIGTEPVCLAMAKKACGGIRLVIISDSASDATKKKLLTKSEFYKVRAAITDMTADKLGELLGGKQNTFSGLSGVGDLIVTCTSGHSRNRHVGEELGRGKTLSEILDAMGMVVAEGVPTSLGAYTLARRAGAETPLIDSIYAILYNDLSAVSALRELMTRQAKAEV